jgi:hypothetical protein
MVPKYSDVLYLLDRAFREQNGSLFWKIVDYRVSTSFWCDLGTYVYILVPMISEDVRNLRGYSPMYEANEAQFDTYAANTDVILVRTEKEHLALQFKYANEILIS